MSEVAEAKVSKLALPEAVCYLKRSVTIASIGGTLLVGLVAQGSGLFNKYSYFDDMSALNSVGTTYPSGRWMLGILKAFINCFFRSSNYSSPLYNGLVSLALLSLVAATIVYLLDIDKVVCACGIGAVFASFPVLTCTFGYMYTAPYYMFSLLLIVFAAAVCTRVNNPFVAVLIGSCLVCCSLGVYQAYLPVFAGLIAINGVVQSLRADTFTRKWAGATIVCPLLTAVLGTVFYLLMTKTSLILLDIQLLEYMSINTMGTTTITGYISRIIFAYSEYFIPSVDKGYSVYVFGSRKLYIAIVVVSSLVILARIIKKSQQSVLLAVLAGFASAIVPLAINLIFIMNDPKTVYSLMVYGKAMPYILLLALVGDSRVVVRRSDRLFYLASMALVISSVFCWIRFDNACYLKAEFMQSQTTSWCQTLVTRIQSIPGFKDELPIAFVNERKVQDMSLSEIKPFEEIKLRPYFDAKTIINAYNWKKYLAHWLGYAPRMASVPSSSANEVNAMRSYPDDGSIKIIDDVIVVKF